MKNTDKTKEILIIVCGVLCLALICIGVYNMILKKPINNIQDKIKEETSDDGNINDTDGTVLLSTKTTINQIKTLDINGTTISLGIDKESDAVILNPDINNGNKYILVVECTDGNIAYSSDETYNYYTGFDGSNIFYKPNMTWDLVDAKYKNEEEAGVYWNCNVEDGIGQTTLKLVFRNIETFAIEYVIGVDITNKNGIYRIDNMYDAAEIIGKDSVDNIIDRLTEDYYVLGFLDHNYDSYVVADSNMLYDYIAISPNGYDSINFYNAVRYDEPLKAITINYPELSQSVTIYTDQLMTELLAYEKNYKSSIVYRTYLDNGVDLNEDEEPEQLFDDSYYDYDDEYEDIYNDLIDLNDSLYETGKDLIDPKDLNGDNPNPDESQNESEENGEENSEQTEGESESQEEVPENIPWDLGYTPDDADE